MVYVVLMRRLPAELRARALALVSSAWMIPSLVGPAVSGVLTDTAGWRAVFGVLLGISALAGCASVLVNRAATAPAIPSAPTTPDAGDPTSKSTVMSAVAATAWSGALVLTVAVLLAGLEHHRAAVGMPLAVLGGMGAAIALRRLTPPGTLLARRGLPAGVAARALLSLAFFGPSTFLALLLVEVRGTDATLAGVVLSVGSLAWVAGATLQARTDPREAGRRSTQILVGYLVLALGVGSVAAVLLATSWPVALVGIGWALAGLGMGLSYNVTTAAALDHTTDGDHGRSSSALQIAQTLGTALAAGLGTAVLAHTTQQPAQGFAALFGIALLCALAGLPIARSITS